MARPELKPFYQSRAWQMARGQALRRDHFTCQLCGARAEEVHHLIELNETNVSDDNIALNVDKLQSLCHDCHTRLTMREHRGIGYASGDDYFFDSDGVIQKIPTAYPPGDENFLTC